MNQLTQLTAPDLFSHDLKQIFDPKTGKWVATIPVNMEYVAKEDKAQTVVEQENKNQLKLF
jgi:hypothetical protein